MTGGRWVPGNRVRLLENGEEYFPRLMEALNEASVEIFVETFILFEDRIGFEFQQAVIAAARRGVHVEITVDGYGSADLSASYVEALTEAGILFHVYRPKRKLFGMRTNMFRRLHRKIVSIDGRLAFIGGMNIELTHVEEYGPESKQDYAVEVEGPIALQIHHFAQVAAAKMARNSPRRRWWRRPPQRSQPLPARLEPVGPTRAMFVVRDNERHRNDIERCYREALRSARDEIIIANAYFFPGHRLLREIRNAARRGVRVRLILQGKADMRIAKLAPEALYRYLLEANVQIYEYCRRPLHAKVALVDDEWATVGSSNLDPLSLFLNLECNLVMLDGAFNRYLRERLEWLMENSCEEVRMVTQRHRTLLHLTLNFLAFHVLRRFPGWAGWSPAHRRRLFGGQRPAVDDRR